MEVESTADDDVTQGKKPWDNITPKDINTESGNIPDPQQGILTLFATAVLEIARSIAPDPLPDSADSKVKVFISAVFFAAQEIGYSDEFMPVDLPTFRTQLAVVHAGGLLELAKCESPQDYPKETVKESATRDYERNLYHYVVVDPDA
ncbi:MAG: hypothetical protein GY862_17335 [Gammaproteobacteria bacterium]|nr:hypothetical protein [Gammaproteobacteria bacterium]